MDIFIYDTKQREKRAFVPLDPNCVSIYVCGPTVYDRIHIGNGMCYVMFDVFVRLLRLAFPRVKYVRNITDIDDKINAAALRNNEPISDLTSRFSDAFHEDADALYILPPDVEPRPTLLIPEIISMIEELENRGHAYHSQGHVLFHVNSFDDYGSLSQRSLDDMLDGARVEIAPYKKDAKDFVLWKPSTDELPGWESPWGRGRPGWHIECSTMIHEHLGTTIDIHGAGSDLTFPHNENELAQSRCAHDDASFVRYWMHNGMLTMGTRKMSKSLGNIVTIRDLLEKHRGETIRYALLTGHYRQNLLWDDRLLEQAKQSLATLYRALRHVKEITKCEDICASKFDGQSESAFPTSVVSALADDLHTPRALAELHALASNIQQTTAPAKLLQLRSQLLAGGWLLGLMNYRVTQYFESSQDLDVSTIERLIDERNEARKKRDFDRADEIRASLLSKGIELEDTREGTRWSNVNR